MFSNFTNIIYFILFYFFLNFDLREDEYLIFVLFFHIIIDLSS